MTKIIFTCIFFLLLNSCSPFYQNTAYLNDNLTTDIPSIDIAQKPEQKNLQYAITPNNNKPLLNLTTKVGISLHSDNQKIPLSVALKKITACNNIRLSWAVDTNPDFPVIINVDKNEDLYEVLNHLLQQAQYSFVITDHNHILVTYRHTKQFHIAMPFTKQNYIIATGGNILGNNEGAKHIDGTVKITSTENNFGTWENIELNLQNILDMWKEKEWDFSYTINKPTGLITVTAPQYLLQKIDIYLSKLKKEFYKQIAIEAKIIEVQLTNSSSTGINWQQALEDFAIKNSITFGNNGQLYPVSSTDGGNRFVSQISLTSPDFTIFLNALKQHGKITVLSNPKISVLNGQPAMITVGRNVTYINKSESDIDPETHKTTYSSQTERVLSGIALAITATISNDDEIIMNLVPVTSELEEPVKYEETGSGKIGLPVINVREMNTTVRVKNNDMLIIGGLISDVNDQTDDYIPIIGELPILKYIFSHEQKNSHKRELIILLSPKIME